MRQLIQKIGRINAVIIITVFSILFSVGLTLVISYFRQDFEQIQTAIFIATIIPLVVAPLSSWPLIGLLFKIDTLEREMRKLATFDSLTELLSRHAFFHNAKAFIELANREKIIFSVIILDIDKFKNINDNYGHSAGDEILKNFAKITHSILRKGDIIGRIGGDEFALLLPNSTENAAYSLSQRLLHAIEGSVINYDNLSLKYTVSMGLLSVPPTESDTIENILKKADQSLYLAKRSGRNRTMIFDESNESILQHHMPSETFNVNHSI